jgi:hypothetical protein
MNDMLRLLLEAKRNIESVCAVPSTMILPRKAETTAAIIQQTLPTYQRGLEQRTKAVQDGMIAPLFGCMEVIVSDLLPKEYVTVGHTFRDVPPAKHRSLRLWKKLRYGKRRCHVEPIIEEFDVAFMINESAMKQAMIHAMNFENRHFRGAAFRLGSGPCWRGGWAAACGAGRDGKPVDLRSIR